MSRRKPTIDNLSVRKRLLVSEAELHREEMIRDFGIVSAGVEELGRKARTVGSVASVVALVIGGFSALRGVRKRSPGPASNGRASFMSRLFQGARLASTVWRGWQSIKPRR